MQECQLMANEIPRNRCPATDSLDWLDDHPEYRLALEDTWSDSAGRVYSDVPADVVSRWPGHIARTFKPTFAAEVEQMLLDDFEKSVEMQPGDYENRSFWFKLGVRLARLTAPVQ
jgi:hypothetical protein